MRVVWKKRGREKEKRRKRRREEERHNWKSNSRMRHENSSNSRCRLGKKATATVVGQLATVGKGKQ